jgi:hypothetical protein
VTMHLHFSAFMYHQTLAENYLEAPLGTLWKIHLTADGATCRSGGPSRRASGPSHRTSGPSRRTSGPSRRASGPSLCPNFMEDPLDSRWCHLQIWRAVPPGKRAVPPGKQAVPPGKRAVPPDSRSVKTSNTCISTSTGPTELFKVAKLTSTLCLCQPSKEKAISTLWIKRYSH